MGDAMKKVRTGDPLVVPAQAYNAFIDAAKDFHQRTANLGQQATPGYRSAGIVLVKNESGEDRARFDVLGIGEPIFLPAPGPPGSAGAVAEQSFKNAVVFRGGTPDATLHRGKFVILLEPLAAGAIGRAYLAGVTVARLRLEDAAQQVTHAEIIDADATALQPAVGGSAAVLWHQELSGAGSGDVWAVVRLGNAAPAGVWVQITSTQANGGQYASWQEVEVTDDVAPGSGGGLAWSAVPDGLNGTDDGTLYEVNGVESIPADTIVQAFVNPAYDPATGILPAWLFRYEQPQTIGFGTPADGEVDVPHDADIDLIVTDAGGMPILDGQGQQQTIKVWRNALKRPLYTDFQSGDVFVYVRFPQPAPSGHGGCIFSRTEAFKSYREWLPEDGYSLYPTEQPPATTDVTGDAGNEDHVHVIGKMYMEDDAEGKGWAPWFVLDPEAFGSFKVKTDEDDDTPDYLDAKLDVGENTWQTHAWLDKRIDHQTLRLFHGDWDANHTQVAGNLISLDTPGANVRVIDDAIDPGPGTAWLTFTEYEDEFDDKKHGRIKAKAGVKKLVIDGIGKVFTDANDTTPGHLDDEIVVTPPSGHAWLTKTVQPGGEADNRLLLEHNDCGPKTLTVDPLDDVSVVDIDGTPTLRIRTRPAEYDAKGHYTGEPIVGSVYNAPLADEKVKASASDPSAGYLSDKVAGDGAWVVKNLQSDRVALQHGPPQAENVSRGIDFNGGSHISVYGTGGLGSPRVPVDAKGHVSTSGGGSGGGGGVTISHDSAGSQSWTLDPVVSLSVSGTSLRIASRPASVDNKGHMRSGGGSTQYHDLGLVGVDVVTDFRVDGTELQVKTRTIYVPKVDAESDWTTVHTGTECPSEGGT